ncbi:tryptophan ABC transporter substrate-binding protein [Streptococcus suis]|uniref:Tryptophan ABC transporter substrate-binding protein n=1 Tax=Streptococcus suis TaxID=1307 RepID=A0AAJ2PDK2_STRSU|nr:tryptophan ABC transporter substrate-binding protein [Streptococcus suis]MCK3922108.1 ABC transporter substrate-binding protein [Streptococcus suis]MCK3953257.1 ABC transporter substrate-binding protein [Streptococcus suis]MCK4056684.1 ABC transporter substrate-binding protein [Streptococcus suis]MDW8586151.1 tryptophan ABC transporter substrate-binding protein [Streptococcus suis]MDW8644804.1 tryptophan ABC transporter substrate-binding protein [Streptococcus suis]
MKNKNLLATIVALTVMVVAALFMTQKEQSNSSTSTEKVKIGVLQFVTHDSLDEIYKGIKAGLEEGGYTTTDNLEIDFMNAEGDQSQVQTMSKKLVDNGNELLIGIATPAAQGLANATTELPIIMGAVTDPVGANLVTDLKNPGGNITGVSDQTPVADAVSLIKEITPDAKTIGVLYSSNEDNSKIQVAEFKAAAEEAGYTVLEYAVASSNEIAATVEVASSKADVLFTPVDNTVASAFSTVVSVANKTKTPIFTSVEDMVEGGGIASVTLSQYDLGVATGKMAAKILDGANPADTPVQIFNEGTVVVNQKVAKELGITLSDDVISKASKVIE